MKDIVEEESGSWEKEGTTTAKTKNVLEDQYKVPMLARGQMR